MAEDTLSFKINSNRNMDILTGVHGVFKAPGTNLLFGGLVHTVISDYGDMLFQGIPVFFGSIWLSRYDMRQTATLSAEANASSLEVMHLLAGNISFEPDGIKETIDMKQQHWQMMYLPHVSNKVTFQAGTKLTTLDFHYNPAYLESMAAYFPDLDAFLTTVNKGVAATLCRQPFPIRQDVQTLTAKLFRARNSERDQNLFMERHMADWLATTLESPYLSGVTPIKLRKSEYSMMMEIFEYMKENFADPMPISQLAKQAQMNEYKFKRLFTEIFKIPVHQFLIDQRLKHAFLLVTAGELTLTDIADICGYETLPSFTRIFKQRYGKPPSAFRDNSKSDTL